MAFKDKLKNLVGAVAPLLGASLGGPFGGMALKFLADKFTDGDTGSVEDFILAGSPDTLLELKKAEIEYKKYISDLGLRQSQLDVQDRVSARELASARGTSIQAILSFAYTFGYFFTLFMFITGRADVTTAYSDMVMVLIGALSAPQLQILNFWFGSSKGSKDKNDLINPEAA